MKLLAATLVLVAACSKKSDAPAPAPAPAPTDPAPASPPPPTAEQIKPAQLDSPPPDPSKGCVIKVKITDQVSYESGQIGGVVIKGSTKLSAIDLTALHALAGKCGADITASDDVKYQDVVSVMDMLVKTGITDVGIDTGGKPNPRPAPPKSDQPTINSEWKDGKLTLTGKFDAKQPLTTAPLIVISKTEVLVGATATAAAPTKHVGKPDDGAPLAAEISAALPPSPKDPLIILQADQATSYATIRAAIDGAKQAGYDNVLFAVKNK